MASECRIGAGGSLIAIVLILFSINGCECSQSTAPEDGEEDAFTVNIHNSAKAYAGTTLIPDTHDADQPRIVEVDMHGDVVWHWDVPDSLKEFTHPGFDAERLPGGNTLIELPRFGILEVDRWGNTVWLYQDEHVSHDADRLDNNNILYVFGADDEVDDLQVKEINRFGTIVWGWRAKPSFGTEYAGVDNDGWSHANAVTRLQNGHTLVCLRNFNLIADVAADGSVSRVFEGNLYSPYDPEWLGSGHILLVRADEEGGIPCTAVEWDPEAQAAVWEYTVEDSACWPVRDANRLPNGNTLITGATCIREVTAGGEIVWQLVLAEEYFTPDQAEERGFYKAIRLPL